MRNLENTSYKNVVATIVIFLCLAPSHCDAIRCFNCYGSPGSCRESSMISCSPLTTFCRLEITRAFVSQSCARDIHCTPESFLATSKSKNNINRHHLRCCSSDGCNCNGQRQCAVSTKPINNYRFRPENKPSPLRCFSCFGNAGQCLSGKMITCPPESQYCKLTSNAASGIVSQTCARRVNCPYRSFRFTTFDTAKDIVNCCKTPGCNCIASQCSQID